MRNSRNYEIIALSALGTALTFASALAQGNNELNLNGDDYNKLNQELWEASYPSYREDRTIFLPVRWRGSTLELQGWERDFGFFEGSVFLEDAVVIEPPAWAAFADEHYFEMILRGFIPELTYTQCLSGMIGERPIVAALHSIGFYHPVMREHTQLYRFAPLQEFSSSLAAWTATQTLAENMSFSFSKEDGGGLPDPNSQLSYGEFGGVTSPPVRLLSPYSAIGMGSALSGALRFLEIPRR